MSDERFTLDTSILVCSIDARERSKRERAIAIITAAIRLDCPLALQAVGEFHVVAIRKLKLSPRDAAARAQQLLESFETFAHSSNAIRVALEEASNGTFSFWDGVLLASAAEAGCTAVLSENMADGARLGSITVCNPFDGRGLSDRARGLLHL